MDEVWEAIRDYEGIKAPGTYSLNLNFIKSNCEVIKDDGGRAGMVVIW